MAASTSRRAVTVVALRLECVDRNFGDVFAQEISNGRTPFGVRG